MTQQNPDTETVEHIGEYPLSFITGKKEDESTLVKQKHTVSYNPTLEGWEERFDKQFGKAGSEMDSDSVGRSAGCDDCSINIKLREEHKNFIRTLITAAKEEAERKAYERVIDSIYPKEIEELPSEAIDEWKQQLRAKFLNQGEGKI